MPIAVRELAADFLAEFPIRRLCLDTPAGASGLCVWVTVEFLKYVLIFHPGTPVRIVETLGHPRDPHFWHCFAWVDNVYVDLTLRQIEPESPFPWIGDALPAEGVVREHAFPFTREPFCLV